MSLEIVKRVIERAREDVEGAWQSCDDLLTNINTFISSSLDITDALRNQVCELRDHLGHSLVSFAAGQGDMEAIRVLAEWGADVTAANRYGVTPVWAAAAYGHLEAIRALAKLGVDVEAAHHFGATPVWVAAQNGHVDAIRVLAEWGADVRAANNNGVPPVSIARRHEHREVVELLDRIIDFYRMRDAGDQQGIYALAKGEECLESRLAKRFIAECRYSLVRLCVLAWQNPPRATINLKGTAVREAKILADIEAFKAKGLALSSHNGRKIIKSILDFWGPVEGPKPEPPPSTCTVM